VIKPNAEKKESTPKSLKSGGDRNTPPQVGVGQQAVWHEPYSYKNKLGNEVSIRGHWEVVKKQEKPKEAMKAEK